MWTRDKQRWGAMAQALKSYRNTFGHSHVPSYFTSQQGFKLGMWLAAQKEAHRKNLLSDARIKCLEDLDVEWDSGLAEWAAGFISLERFRNLHGHCDVPLKFRSEDGINLGNWLLRQIQLYNNNTLPDDRIRRLKEVGIRLDKA